MPPSRVPSRVATAERPGRAHPYNQLDRPESRLNGKQRVTLAQPDDVARVLWFRNLATQQAGAQPSNLITVQVAQIVADDARRRRRPRPDAEPGEFFEDFRAIIGHTAILLSQ